MMRSHIQTRDDVHRETSSKLEASERHYQKRVKSLDEKAASLSRRYATLASRRGLEMEGYNSEINILRRMLRDAENNLFKLKNPYPHISPPFFLSLSLFPFSFPSLRTSSLLLSKSGRPF
jgi:predicted RNase H-like nuclease (RuvC/YqgF family)